MTGYPDLCVFVKYLTALAGYKVQRILLIFHFSLP